VRTGLWHLRKGGPSQFLRFVGNRRRRIAGRPQFLFRSDGDRRTFQPWQWPDAVPRRGVRVGIIADAFTSASFRYEWDQVALTRDGWRTELDAAALEMLFVESAWAGNGSSWQYCLTGPSAPHPELVALVAECRRRGIPTVFWNKEDPTHFEDFFVTAQLFDWVFTTDSECLPEYRRRLGHDRVAALPFAVPDRVCNPVRVSREHQPLGIAFAGTWFAHKYPERRDQMVLLFDAALAAETPENRFEIFSRFLKKEARYQFPEPYASHVVGSLDYDRMLSAYRSYKVFLNVNTVTSSPTMCARRALEITACGTPVVSTPAPALATFLGAGVIQVSEPAPAQEAVTRLVMDPDERARLVHVGQRELWRAHTYEHRVAQVLTAVGLGGEPVRLPTVSILVATKRPHQLEHVLDNVARQRDCELELLVGTHGFDAPTDFVARARELGIGAVSLVPMDETARLGECLNALAGRAEGDVLAKMDDDDWYGADYLADSLRAMRFSGADVVGKHARFVYLEAHDATVLAREQNEHRFTDFVAGPTLTLRRDVQAEVPFAPVNRGEDSTFLREAVRAGMRVYAADRFNFIQYRSRKATDHTWVAADEHFLKSARRCEGHAVTLAGV